LSRTTRDRCANWMEYVKDPFTTNDKVSMGWGLEREGNAGVGWCGGGGGVDVRLGC
jgi:hypothetical protein